MTIVQAITHITVDLMKNEAQEHGAQWNLGMPEQIIFKLTWVLNILFVQ